MIYNWWGDERRCRFAPPPTRKWNGVESVGSLGRRGSGALLIQGPSMTKQQRGDPIHWPKWSKRFPFPQLSPLLSGCVILLRDGEVCHRRSLLWITDGLANMTVCFVKIKKWDWLEGNALPGRVPLFGWLFIKHRFPCQHLCATKMNIIWVANCK